jgi:hypothetical protein
VASQNLDADLSGLTAAFLMHLHPELNEMVPLGYTQDSLYGDEGEWTKGGPIATHDGCFWINTRLCISDDPVLKQKLLLHDNGSLSHRGFANTLANALDGFANVTFDKTLMTTIKYVLFAVAPKSEPKWRLLLIHYLYHLDRPWYIVGLDFPTHLPISASFDNVLVVIDHLRQMAHLFPCIEKITAEETRKVFLQGLYRLHGLPRVLVSARDPRLVSDFWQTL